MIVRLTQVFANNIVFTLKIRLCLYKIAINYLLFPFFMLFFDLYKIISFTFFVFLYIIMYILNIARTIKKIPVNEIRYFIFENYYKRIRIVFSEKNS